MRVLAYWGARTGIFVVVLGILWLVGWRDVIAFIAAFIVAWLVSYLALPRLKVAAAAQMDGWITRSERGIKAADQEEDAELDHGSSQPERG